MKIGCSGQVSERSGIGVVQKHLYDYLVRAGHDLVESDPRDVGTSSVDQVHGLMRGFRPAKGAFDVYLSAVPPVPFGVRAPLLTLVHDLRWLRTRSKLGAAYRAWDLRRAVTHSDALICVSNTTLRSLHEFDARATGKSASSLLGTGLVPEDSFADSKSGVLMLVGGATHKRNEDAADALVAARPSWVKGIVGVGVSAAVQQALASVFPCEWYSNISDAELLTLYQRAEFYLMLGTEEGFGLPFVEALAAGCQVIATDHPLAREVVGEAGILLAPGGPAEIADQLCARPNVSAAIRRKHSQSYCWTKFGAEVERVLMQIVDTSG